MNQRIEEAFTRLKHYLEKAPLEDRYQGFDPFDGLNSKFFAESFFNRFRLPRLIWLQFNKRSPWNVRRLVQTEIGYNPQALGLFISAYAKWYSMYPSEELATVIRFLAEKLTQLQSKGYSGSCWGYNFDWQARAFFQPKFTPMIVPTAFAVEGLLDASKVLHEQKYQETAISAANFVRNDLNRTYDGRLFAFSYSPVDQTVVYNASLLASKLLGKVFKLTGDQELKSLAQNSVDFCVRFQQEDGAWSYGSKPYHQWIDNFHSGYNLTCLQSFRNDTQGEVPEHVLERGLSYYLSTFFEDSGFSKYYHNSRFPFDINNPAQLVLTLSEFGRLKDQQPLVDRVLLWTINNMQDRSGYFYYQKKRYHTVKIPYMRWSQAWMFLALVTYYEANREK